MELTKHEEKPNFDGGNTLELICIKCEHKFGWHHATPNKQTSRVCYGIACQCDGFYHNLCCLEPLFESMNNESI